MSVWLHPCDSELHCSKVFLHVLREPQFSILECAEAFAVSAGQEFASIAAAALTKKWKP
jgi:hypothetical protein